MLNRLRKAGEFLRDKDQAYAGAVQDLIIKHLPEQAVAPMNYVAGVPLSAEFKLTEKDNPLVARALQAGILGTNAAVRYGLPTAGAVGLANGLGGLYNAAAQTPVFGENPADVSDPNLLVTYA